MKFDELVMPIDSSRSCVLQLPTSVIHGMLFAGYEETWPSLFVRSKLYL